MIQHLISIAAALSVGIWATVLSQYHQFGGLVPPAQDIPEIAEVVPAITPPSPFEITLGDFLRPATTTLVPNILPREAPTTSPVVPFTPLPIPTPPVITTPTVPTAPVTPVVQNVEETLSAEALLKAAVVNIICLPGGGLRGSSGSGVVIDPRGIIVTVAHVGQNFLLVDYPQVGAGTCYIRTGSPAKNAYTAKLVYISTEWVDDNETTLLEARPKGTGENDYAFLAITGSVTTTPLPSTFSYIPFARENTEVEIGDRVGVGSYGAEFLSSSEVRSSLYPTISFAPVNDFLTFDRPSTDVISVHAGAAAQEGSSGGAVINSDKKFIGLITTRTVKSDLSLRDLQAISIDHIRRSFREEMGTNLDSYLTNNSPVILVAKFSNTAVELLEQFTDAIDEARN